MENNLKAVKASRKEELLILARRSRSKWVLEAANAENLTSLSKSSINPNMKPNLQSNISSKSRTKLPVEECVQAVLNYLTDMVEDGAYIDVDMITQYDHSIVDYDGAVAGYNDDKSMFQSNSELTNPQDNYLQLLDKLRRPGSFEIVRTIQQFVSKFHMKTRDLRDETSFRRNEDDYLQWADEIWKFIEYFSQLIRNHSIWQHESEITWKVTKESIERFVFTKLHPFIFNCDAEDIYLNQRIKERIISLGFLSPEHLDVKTLINLSTGPWSNSNNNFNNNSNTGVNVNNQSSLAIILDEPIKYLKELNSARCPFDMLNSIRQASFAIGNILKSSRNDGSISGADEFLPMLILVIKSSEINNIHSIIKYLQRFIHSSKLMSESGYLLTHFVSAVHFLENVDAKALTIEPEVFELAMEQCKAEAAAAAESVVKRLRNKSNMDSLHSSTTMASTTRSRSGSNQSNKSLRGNSITDDLDTLSDHQVLEKIEKLLTTDSISNKNSIYREIHVGNTVAVTSTESLYDIYRLFK